MEPARDIRLFVKMPRGLLDSFLSFLFFFILGRQMRSTGRVQFSSFYGVLFQGYLYAIALEYFTKHPWSRKGNKESETVESLQLTARLSR